MRTVFTLRRVALWLLGLAAVVVATDFLTAWYEAGRHSDKLWLHRCNTTAKWLEKRGKFAHFEVDVRFTPEGRFDVTHEAASSIGLGLERYFRLIGPDTTRVWLDIKNLSSANAGAMLAALDSLTRRYAVSRSRLIVESGDWRALALFRRRGYYTSFYVPYAPPSRLSAAERAAWMPCRFPAGGMMKSTAICTPLPSTCLRGNTASVACGCSCCPVGAVCWLILSSR